MMPKTTHRDRQSPWWPLATLALVVACLTLTGAVLAGEGDDAEAEHRIRVHRVLSDCEGEDCPEGHASARAIFVGEDGEVREVDLGAGGEAEWTSEDGAHKIIQRLLPSGGPSGYLGVMLNPLTRELRTHLGVPEDAGVQVSKVVEDSPAFRAGLEVGDVISAVNGEAVTSPRDVASAIRGLEEGDTVDLEVWRDGSVLTLTSSVAERSISDHPVRIFMHHGDEGDGIEFHQKRIQIRCDSETGDCEGFNGNFEFDPEAIDCGGAGECEVRVKCTGAGCDCTINGEAADCAAIPGPHND